MSRCLWISRVWTQIKDAYATAFRKPSGDATARIILPTRSSESDWGILSWQAVEREGGTAYGGVKDRLYGKQRQWETVGHSGAQAPTWPADKRFVHAFVS